MAKFTGHTITSDSALGDAKILRSLRFNDDDSAYLNRTPSSAGNKKTFTFSFWVKRGNLGGSNKHMFAIQIDSSNQFVIRFVNTDKLQIYDYQSASHQMIFDTNSLFRDVSAWYHIVVAVDTTQSTNTDRFKLYVNGSQVTSFSSSTYPSQNHDTLVNTTNAHDIGQKNSALYFDGYLAEYNFIDGYQYDPSYFGFTDPVTNIWMPKRYEGIYGTNGYYLDFSDNSSAAALGIDKSPNGNDFTVNNISVSAGDGNDSLEDTPTSNFCTMNPLVPSPSVTWANGNLDLAGTSSTEYSQTNMSTFGVSSGKWYVEVKYTNDGTTNTYVGVCPIKYEAITNMTGSVTDAAVLRMSNETYIEGSDTQNIFPSGISSGNIIGIALDMDNQKLWFSLQGTYANSGNPATGANAIFSGITAGETMAICARPLSGTLYFNFGQRPFAYTPPLGFKTLESRNLPLNSNVSSVLRPKKHFDVIYYTGQSTSSLYNVTGLEFPPDLVIAKSRNDTIGHIFIDTVRGNDRQIETPDTSAEVTRGTPSYRFLNDGFAVSTGGNLNNPVNYAAFCWRAGGNSNTFNVDGKGYTTAAAAGITDGSIALTGASVNTEAGFSIVKYTSPNSSSDQTVGHGLGKKPDWILVKNLDNSYNWDIYHSSSGYNSSLIFTASTTRSGAFAAEPTSTVFHTKTSYTHNSTHEYIAYCWTEIPGYSKFGTYTGTELDDGPFVYLGFSPAWVMVKCTSNAEHWNIPLFTNDDRSNGTVKTISPNLTNDERNMNDNPAIDFLSNGFKVRTSDGNFSRNNGNHNFIYMAFAEQPGIIPFDTFPNAH